MSKKLLILFFTFFISFNSYASNALYKAYEGLDIKYRWLDTVNYDTHTIDISGLHTSTPHQFGYEFRQVLGKDTLSHIGLTYGYKAGSHWAGFGITSSSNKPFTSLNLIDFDVFYAFRIFQHVTEYENIKGRATAFYSRLYLGVEYSTSRDFLDGYPLPVIRYEYNKPGVNVIFGLPLTYFKVDFLKYSSIEFEYVPVIDVLFSLNLGVNKSNIFQLQFQMENDMYKLSNLIKDVYYSDQEKYYVDTIAARFRYSLTIKDIVRISPYVEFIIDGHHYVSKQVQLFNSSSMGMGYAAGIDISAFF
ncbi:MAG: hypothetical protein MSA07_09605 [Mucispirillum sp.]|uniref:Uncharacterized protein n=1 Tax=Candidatus Mucispirillum faecigallinarum TaxID=2838699 RepID=A0A9D2KBT9_9BACT|nr:hypothetical protein [Mucispirillum sp.]HIZ90125.1 hypothetical protein [Candidatus Mucispirillum faecigallinarum]